MPIRCRRLDIGLLSGDRGFPIARTADTLDMLILRTLVTGPAHGHTIAHVIEHLSEGSRAGIALSGAAPARAPRLGEFALGNERKQPQGKVLQADGCGQEAAQRSDGSLADGGGGDWAHFG
jgi:hypothetical protein